MIDIHCHLLPGLDDGAKSSEEALGIALQLQEAGFKTVIATPHVLEGRDYLVPERILKATEEFNKLLKAHDVKVEILPGSENYLFPDMANWVEEGKLLTLGNTGKYILVELPLLDIPHYTEQVFFDLQVSGVTPVLAHPERNKRLVDEPERLVAWAERGVLFQMELRSLSGRYGPEAERFGGAMLESGLVHLIGTDAHRVAQSGEAYRDELRKIEERVGSHVLEEITLLNPQKVIEGVLVGTDIDYDFNTFLEKVSCKLPRERTFSWTQKFLTLIRK
jgi:protein-tyrosine phosphatase